MNIVENIILDLILNDTVNPENLAQLNIADWNSFKNLFIHHKLSPQLILPILNQLPDNDFKKILSRFYKGYSFEVIKENHIVKNQWLKLRELFRQKGIEAILLKGFLLAEKGEDRVSRDLDILIDVSDLHQAMDILKEKKYEFVSPRIVRYLKPKERRNVLSTISWYNEFHFYSAQKGLLVELHTRLFPRERIYTDDLNTLWEQHPLVIANTDIVEDSNYSYRVLNREMQTIQLCLMLNVKRSPAKRTMILRDLYDFKKLCEKKIDWDRLKNLSQKFGVSYHVYSSLALLDRFYPGVIDRKYLLQLRKLLSARELFMCRLQRRCLKSPVKFNAIYSWLYMVLNVFLLSGKRRFSEKFFFLRRLFFPSRWRIAEMFNLPLGYPMLIFYYCFLPIRALVILLSSLLGLKDIIPSDWKESH